jgi:hypothetical protein
MKTQNEMFSFGDGSSIPNRPKEPRNFNKMRIKDEMKLDLKLAISHSGSSVSRFKLYPIEEVSENSNCSMTSAGRYRMERDAEIQRMLEENKNLGRNRPKSSHRKFKPPIEVKELKPVTRNPSEESITPSVFKDSQESPIEEKANDQKPPDFDADKKLKELNTAVDDILSYKQSHIHRLSASSSYEYHLRKLMPSVQKTSSVELLSNSRSTTSTLYSHQTTSCFGRLFCPSKKSRR